MTVEVIRVNAKYLSGDCYGALQSTRLTPAQYGDSSKRWWPAYGGDILKMLFGTSLRAERAGPDPCLPPLLLKESVFHSQEIL